ncbi:hypothetical protein BH23ACT5_BH23ACT5_08410 [soil metagenome]
MLTESEPRETPAGQVFDGGQIQVAFVGVAIYFWIAFALLV